MKYSMLGSLIVLLLACEASTGRRVNSAAPGDDIVNAQPGNGDGSAATDQSTNNNSASSSPYSCVGVASQDGDGSGQVPLYQWPIQVAGKGSCQVGVGCDSYFDIEGDDHIQRGQWVPGALGDSTPILEGAMPAIESSYARFKVDGAYKIRLITNPEIFPPVGTDNNCYGRKTGIGSTSSFPYTKLKYDIFVRAYTAAGHSVGAYDPSSSTFGERIKIATVGPVSVGECSEPITITPSDFAPVANFQNPDMFYLIEIDNVQSDYLCGIHPNNQNCVGEGMSIHRSFGCVNATLQIATDITDQFKSK